MKAFPSSLQRPHAVAAAVGLLLLSACGGGGGGSGSSDPLVSGSEIPQSATTSAAGAFAFVASVAAQPNDSNEPLVAGDAVLATSDTDEPSAL